MSYTIVVADDLSASALILLKKSPHTVLYGLSHLPQADALILRSVKINAAQIDSAARLKIISRAGVGMDAIDTVYAEKKNILCVNAAGGNSISAAEHTLGLMLSMSHQIARSHNQILNNIWDRTTTEGFELHGKTLGVVGCGNVGSKVCRLALAFGMQVLVYDPYITAFPEGVVVFDSLEELLKKCDILTLHVPLTQETKEMINSDRLNLLKDGTSLVNASRGAVVELQALVQASSRFKAIALDVYPEEPLPHDFPLIHIPNITLTPHLGGASTEARERVAVMAVKSVLSFLEAL